MLWLLFVLAVAAALIAWGVLPALAGADLSGSPRPSDPRWRDLAAGCRQRLEGLRRRFRRIELPERVRELLVEDQAGDAEAGGFVFGPVEEDEPRPWDAGRASATAALIGYIIGMAAMFAVGAGVVVVLIGRTLATLLRGA